MGRTQQIGQIMSKLNRVLMHENDGFLLPVVIALGVAISTVSVFALQGVAQNSVITNGNYYDTLAKEAANAGKAAASSCISANTLSWTDTAPLQPNTDCNGVPNADQPNYITKNDNYSSYYKVLHVEKPTATTLAVTSKGYVDLLKPDGTVAKQYTKTIRTLKRSTPNKNISKNVDSLSVGFMHACVAAESQAYCWGENGNGQLGTWNSTADSSLPVAVDTNATYAAPIVPIPNPCGGLFQAACTRNAAPAHPVSGLAGKSVIKVAAGNDHSCALTTENLVYCWGGNSHGQLGNRSNTDSSVPVAVDTQPLDIAAIPSIPNPCGGFFQPACTTPAQAARPKSGLAGKRVIDIQAGQYFTCALTDDGDVACWGDNTYGQLGVNDRTDRTYPVSIYRSDARPAVTQVPNPCGGFFQPACTTPAQAAKPATVLWGKRVVKLGKLSNAQHVCVIADDNLPYCWGRNYGGQDGNDVSHGDDQNSMSSTCDTTDGSCYYSSQCVQMNPGDPPITKDNDALQPAAVYMGTDTTTKNWFWTTTVKGSALNGKTVTALQANGTYSTALGSDGKVYWWGGSTDVTDSCNCYNSSRYDSTNQVNIQTLNCTKTTTRHYYIVSRAIGPLYNGQQTCWFVIFSYNCNVTTPVDNQQFSMIAGNANAGTFCGLTGTDLYCQDGTGSTYGGNFSFWGYQGQLGDKVTPLGSWSWSSQPSHVYMDGWLSGKTIADIGTGAATDRFLIFNSGVNNGEFSCALAGNQVGCWGDNAQGQLGTGDVNDRNEPTAVSVDSPLGKPGGGGGTYSDSVDF